MIFIFTICYLWWWWIGWQNTKICKK